MKRMTQTMAFVAVALLLVLGVEATSLAARPAAETMVVFTADWCASCSTLVPSVQGVARSLGLPVQLINVDAVEAPQQAKDVGLSIPTKELPQVYYVKPGASTLLLLDGSQYSETQATQAKNAVQSKLIQVRP